MATHDEYIQARLIIDEWLQEQPKSKKYPGKSPLMSMEDYMKKLCLNEILRFFDKHEALTYDDFTALLSGYSLHPFSRDYEGRLVKYVLWFGERQPLFKEENEGEY
jgi:hypothetical protein